MKALSATTLTDIGARCWDPRLNVRLTSDTARIKRGARVTAAPGGGLFAAGWWGHTEILDLLIRAGAPIDLVVGVTPFLAPWCWRRFIAAKFLALKGANVNFQDRKGKTALHHGVEKEFDPASRKRDQRFLATLG